MSRPFSKAYPVSLKQANKKPPPTKKMRDGLEEKAATHRVEHAVASCLLFKTPLFPVTCRQRHQLYYEGGLLITVPNTGLAGSYVFSANGMYDPNITGTGHQPLGFDQMMVLYEQYVVVSSSIKVTLQNAAITCAAVYLSPDATPLTASSEIMENGYVTKTALPLAQTVRLATLEMNCDVAKYLGRPSGTDLPLDDQLTGTAAANPAEQIYFVIAGWYGVGNPGSSSSLYFDVTLSYDVIYTEPRKLASS